MFTAMTKVRLPKSILIAGTMLGCGGISTMDHGGSALESDDGADLLGTSTAALSDPCSGANVTGTGYCGYTKQDGFSGAADPHVVYNCSQGASRVYQVCGGQCQIAPVGQSDTCLSPTPGSINGLGKCLDIEGAATSNGTKVELWDCNGGNNQQFRITTAGEIRIGADTPDTCLDVTHSQTANGTKVQEYACNGTNAQKWDFRDMTLRSGLGKCVDVPNNDWTQGKAVQLWDCNSTSAQKWTYEPATGELRGQNGLCLDVYGGSTASGTTVQIWPCNGTAAQIWRPAEGGFVSGVQSDLCLDIQNGQTANGTRIQTYACNNTTAQRFALSGPVRSRLNAAKCLDITSSGRSNGTQVQIYDCNNTSAQSWDLWARTSAGSRPVDWMVSNANAISEFSPAFGRQYNGTCTQASAAIALTAANGLTTDYQTMVNLMISMRDVMSSKHLLTKENGSATISAMATELRSRGADIAVQWNNSDAMRGNWQGVLSAHAGIDPIILQVAEASNIRNADGVPQNAGVQVHAIAILGRKAGVGYFVADPNHANPYVDVYSESMLEAAVPCGLIMLTTHTEPTYQPPDPSFCGAGDNNGPNNGWCGSDHRLYYCYQKAWILKQDCNSLGLTCRTRDGAADYCG